MSTPPIAPFPSLSSFSIIALDADDTLWNTEFYYQKAESQLINLLCNDASEAQIRKTLLSIETKNMPLYGYGAKAFTLSLIETTIQIHGHQPDTSLLIQKILHIGQELIEQPIEILPGVPDFLKCCQLHHVRCIVITKGDPIDQERKFSKSSLQPYFEQYITTSDKLPSDYLRVLENLNIAPESFLMIGNSMKSDILPVLRCGGYAIYVPFHLNWAHEVIQQDENALPRFMKCESLADLCPLFSF